MIETETFWPTTRPQEPVISDEELEYLFYIDKEEMMWKKSQPNYRFSKLINIYGPKAIPAARRGLKTQLKFLKQRTSNINKRQEDYYENRILKLPWQERNEFKEESDRDFDQMRSKMASKIKTIMFNLSKLDELDGKAKPRIMGGVSEADVARAKEVPITDFISGGMIAHRNRAVTICPFHSEKQPSLTIYLDQNSWWCYSCQSGGSVVNFIMRQQNVDFLSAVKFLLK